MKRLFIATLMVMFGKMVVAQDATPRDTAFVQPSLEQVQKATVGTLGPHVVNVINQTATGKPPKIVNANYPGGEKAMVASINSNLKYPKNCKAKKKEGVATVSFFIEPNGTCTEYKVESEPCDGMGNEVIRVLKLLKKWNPATVDGVPTRQQYRFPVNFRLNPNQLPQGPPKPLTEAQKKQLQAEFDKLPLAEKKKIIEQQNKMMQQQQAAQKQQAPKRK